MIQRVKPEQVEEFDMMLAAPLPGREARQSTRLDELEAESFMGLYAMVGGNKKASTK